MCLSNGLAKILAKATIELSGFKFHFMKAQLWASATKYLPCNTE